MNKKTLAVCAAVLSAAALSAYNPPVGGESMNRLSSPTQLASASSAAGGALYSAGPDSIAFNPAITAYEQRIALDAGYTLLFSTDDSAHPLGSSFQSGILVPWKWCIGSAYFTFNSLPFDEMELGNSFSLKAGVSKQITDNISIGLGMNSGFFWGYDKDWALGADAGVLYRRENLGFMKDFRFGVSLQNLGKNYNDTTLIGINDDEAGEFPGLATLRIGTAATLLSVKDFKLGMSFDIAAPAFQNAEFDAGLQMSLKDSFFVAVSEAVNVRETGEGHNNFMPAVSLGYKFIFSSKDNAYLQKNGWQQSEMLASAAWQQMYETVNACSGGLKMKLGLQDTDPPKIELWDEGAGE